MAGVDNSVCGLWLCLLSGTLLERRSSKGCFGCCDTLEVVALQQRVAPSGVVDGLREDLGVRNTDLGTLGAEYYYLCTVSWRCQCLACIHPGDVWCTPPPPRHCEPDPHWACHFQVWRAQDFARVLYCGHHWQSCLCTGAPAMDDTCRTPPRGLGCLISVSELCGGRERVLSPLLCQHSHGLYHGSGHCRWYSGTGMPVTWWWWWLTQ